MDIRDRIIDFRRIKASELRPNPRNWRLHPPAQQDALRGILAEVGYVDGHLRAETTPDSLVPVLIVDLSDEEAAKVLATFDPLSAMAQTDPKQLEDLLQQFNTSSDAVQQMLDGLVPQDEAVPPEEEPSSESDIPERYAILINCSSEAEQLRLLEQFQQEGIECRALIA